MSNELGAFINGLLLGCLVIGLGGILIGSSPIPGVVFTSIAIIGLFVFQLVRKDYE